MARALSFGQMTKANKQTAPSGQSAGKKSSGKSEQQCRVLFLYEEASTAAQALKIYQHLQSNLSPDCLMIAMHWSFEEMGKTETQQNFLKNVGMADIVVVATRDVAGLPGGMRELLQKGFAARTTKAAALSLLIGRTMIDPGPGLTLLLSMQTLAKANGLDFFPSEFVMPAIPERTILTTKVLS